MGGRLATMLLICAAIAALASPAGGGRAHLSPRPLASAPTAGILAATPDRAGDDVCGRRWA
jgi:hypothetical protein